MKPKQPGTHLPDGIAGKLRAIRRRGWTVTLAEGLLLTVAVALGAIVAAMAIDWAVGWFDVRARYSLTFLGLGAMVVAFVAWCVRPLAHRRPFTATAREVDRTAPQLEERWSSVTELAQSEDPPEVRGSEALIGQVGREAESLATGISPATVVSLNPVRRAAWCLAGAFMLFGLFFAVNFTQANLLFQRFWMPGRNISLTHVTAAPADVWVPKGEPLVVQATVEGRQPATPPRLFVRNGRPDAPTIVMSAQGGATGKYRHGIDEVSDSIEYRVRAGDGQTPWHRITAAERPRISQIRLKITPPAYSRLPAEDKDALPPAIRVLQGSAVEVSFRSEQPLEALRLDLGDGRLESLTADPDRWYRFLSRPTNSFAFAATAINQFQLENKIKPSCRVGVYEDLAPSVRILEPSDDVTVPPGEKVNVTFEATDDLGLAKAELIVATTKAGGEANTVTIPVDLEADAGRKQLRRSIPLDLQALGLEHGDQLSYTVRVTDTKETSAQTGTEARSAASRDLAAAKPDDAESLPGPVGLPASAAQNSRSAGGDRPSTAGEPRPAEAGSNQGSQPPPNDMAMRRLDAGQSATCTPRNITVDEWAGSFDGEKRRKLEIAIEPVLQQLDALLAQAQEGTTGLQQSAASATGLQPADAGPLGGARKDLGEARRVVGELKSRTSGTPYAFIGLQLHNIGETHVVPADESLTRVSLERASASADTGHIGKASFHIARARELLAELTKTYETVKRDQKIADAMQRLNKMHQVFLEDTQAFLGGATGPINAYDRKIAEVDDAYVEKLKALLEEKKKVLDELARLLSEDPRLLRRYLAMLELQGTSYRDQMTMLARRQKTVADQVAAWNAAPEGERPSLLTPLRADHAARQRQVAADAARLRENLETWLPLDVRPEDERVQAAFTHAEKVVQLAGTRVGATAPEPGTRALEELRGLRELLPRLDQVPTTNQARMATYIANRLSETEALITAQSGQLRIGDALAAGDVAAAAEVIQHGVNVETVTLGGKLEATESQVARMSSEIAEKAESLNHLVRTEIIGPQTTCGEQLAARDTPAAGQTLAKIVPAFERAEELFDELMRLIIAKMDEAPAPTSPGGAQDLDSLLAMLEDEMKAAEGLGVPCRPLNVSVMRDWMRPGSMNGSGMGQAQARAAQGQARQAQAETERLEKRARGSAQRALAEARKVGEAGTTTGEVTVRSEAWNKLASRLQKDLLQGRDNTPPEQYREAIEHYFQVIAETATTGGNP